MYRKLLLALILVTKGLLFAPTAHAFAADDDDELKIAALEALMSAPEERALPTIRRVLAGEHSDEVKEAALFVLAHMNSSEAGAIIVELAQGGGGEVQEEAIRMLGINGDTEMLGDIYANGDGEIREAVLEAYLIAGDVEAIQRIAEQARDNDEFEEAVEMLGAMGARAALRSLRNHGGDCEALVSAFHVADDEEMLLQLAGDPGDKHCQVHAIEGLGLVGSPESNARLVEIYRDSDDEDIRDAALDGMFIADNDDGLLELYRTSGDPAEKKQLLEYLAHMNSDAVWDIIDQTLTEDQ